MKIDFIGSNWVGKTTLARQFVTIAARRGLNCSYQELEAYLASHRTPLTVGQQLLAIIDQPCLFWAYAKLLFQGRSSVANRFWIYYCLQGALLRDQNSAWDALITSEGGIKNVFSFERYYSVVSEDENKWWLNFASRTQSVLVTTGGVLVDLLFYVHADVDEVLRRARKRDRDFCEQVGMDAIRERYLLEASLFQNLIEHARSVGISAHKVDTTDMSRATREVFDIVADVRARTNASEAKK